jgi:hypothetical protein
LWTVAQPKEESMVTLVLDLAGLGMSTIMNKEVANIVRAQVCVRMLFFIGGGTCVYF